MVSLSALKQISDYEWEIPQETRGDMRVPVRLFATRQLLEAAFDDKSIEQAINAATLPGLVGKVIVMPDVHQGYGFPIGGVAATRLPDGVISPGAIGYDINCGVRLLGSTVEYKAIRNRLDDLATALNQYCPSGVGSEGALRLNDSELNRVCENGSKWTQQKGYATEQDLRRTEEGGCLEGADPSHVSKRAKERGRSQLGTLGAGNHFIEVDVVAQVYDENAAAYIQKLNALDTSIKIQVAQIPPEKRLLVTSHDSLGYFAAAYGFQIVGAVIPSVSSEASPSAQHMAALINTIQRTKAPAIFLDASENRNLAQQIASSTGAKVVSDLYVETLSASGGPAATYVDMMQHDASAIVGALK